MAPTAPDDLSERSESGAAATAGTPGGPRGRGADQTGLRDWNERLVLSLVRRHGALSKAQIARRAQLSAQGVASIVGRLEARGLLARGEAQRGQVGQPAIPFRIRADGAHALGLEIGRRSAEMVCLDFAGGVLGAETIRYRWPDVEAVIAFARGAARRLSPPSRPLAGLGVALPGELWNWQDATGAPPGALESWRTIDLRGALSVATGLEVTVENDATAACGADLLARSGAETDFLYVFVGAFVGGGVVLGGSVFPGPSANAGALGPLPIPVEGGTGQLLDVASLIVLERAIAASPGSPPYLFGSEDWPVGGEAGAIATRWLARCADALAHAMVSACSIIDFEAVIIDGALPPEVRARLVRAVGESLSRLDLRGLRAPRLLEGAVGARAPAIGAATLALRERYLLNADAIHKRAPRG